MERQTNEPTHESEHQQTIARPSSTPREARTPISDISSHHDYELHQDHTEPDPSEPSLRFPRPIGNTHLAHWISNSDPDIMRVTSESVSFNEDSDLAGSSYELLTHADDTASENNDESFSESVSSLDQRRSDDVHSVSEDDEDIPMLVQASLPVPQLPSGPEQYDSDEDESDTNSRSSLEYTQEKLGTPSMGPDETPKASAMWKVKAPKQDKRSKDGVLASAASQAYGIACEALSGCYTQVKDDVQAFKAALQWRNPEGIILRIIAIAVFQVVVFSFGCFVFKAAYQSIGLPARPAASTAATTTVTASSTGSIPQALTTTRTDLNVRDEGSTLDWIFSREIGVSYNTADNTFLVDVPDPVKKDCIVISATREGKEIDTNLHKVEKGVAATLPRRERYGDVDFVVQSSCRPKIKQTVTVNFGPYENELTALARQTKDLVLRVAEEQASSWANAYEFFSDRRDVVPLRSFEKALQVVGDRLTEANQAAQKSIEQLLPPRVRKEVVETFGLVQRKTEVMVRDAQTNLQLGLLNSQISAKLWWLKVTHQDAERERYRIKALAHVSDKAQKAKLRAAIRHQEQKKGCSYLRGLVEGRC